MKLIKTNNPTFYKTPTRTRKSLTITRAEQSQQSLARVIRLCRECVHFSEADDTCKVLNIINHINMDVTRIKSLHCRTREDLCGMDARYYEQAQQEKEPIQLRNASYVDDVEVVPVFNVTYYIDGSVGVNTDEASVDNYYHTLHRDFNDVY
jgi:hypothetical protein